VCFGVVVKPFGTTAKKASKTRVESEKLKNRKIVVVPEGLTTGPKVYGCPQIWKRMEPTTTLGMHLLND
jgi:hypothetical protein